MKILLAGQAFYQHNNGQAVFTINLAEGLVEAGLAKIETHTRQSTIQHYLAWYRLMRHADSVVTRLQPALPVGLPQPQVITIQAQTPFREGYIQ